MLLLATTTVICDAQAPAGALIECSDGSYKYIVDSDDRLGQWQVAFGNSALWLELISANPQLKNPHRINPGDTLNVPTSMVRLFRIMIGSHNLATTTHDTVLVSSTAKSNNSQMPDWMMLIIFLGIAVILYRLGSTRTRTEIESRLRMEDPYSGPDRVEGGLPTAEAALHYFANVYENERTMMSVGEAAHCPPVVHIVRMVPVDVKGPMWILYGNSDDPVEKNLPHWTPAWQCWLDDGTYRIALMRCGNDVRSGLGMSPLSDDQIRPRQDMEAVEINRQIWPVVSEEEKLSSALKLLNLSADAPPYREARVKSKTRIVLLPHGEGQEKTVDISDFAGMALLSIIDGHIIVEVGEKLQVIGKIDEKDPLKEETEAENLSLIKASETADPAPSVD